MLLRSRVLRSQQLHGVARIGIEARAATLGREYDVKGLSCTNPFSDITFQSVSHFSR
jgi:hypothetical protein